MSRRRVAAIVAILVIASVFGLASLLEPPTHDPQPGERVPPKDLIQPAENGSYLWPYTSRSASVDGRSLAMVFVIHAPDDAVRRALVGRQSFVEDPEGPEEPASNASQGIQFGDDGIDWSDAHGADRFTYVTDSPDGDGQWIEESYQVHTGTYLGVRQHVRAYASPTDEWTALQVHTDYWDWFRLRHTVSDVQDARTTIEDDFIGRPYVEHVSHEYYDIKGARSDGWLSVIELAAGSLLPIGLLFGLVATDTRRAFARAARATIDELHRHRRGLALAALLAGIVLGVRIAGVAVETTAPGLHPKVIAAVLYPVLAIGLPVATALGAREVRPGVGVAAVALGVGGAFVFDFSLVAVTFVPVRLVLHRIGLLVALGLIAAGSALDDWPERQLLAAGAIAWVVGLALPLFGML